MNTPDIWFPYLGIKINSLDKIAFTIFGIDIYWYAVIIAISIYFALLLAQHEAKSTNQNPELYWDFGIVAIFFSFIGARIYYVALSWDNYKDNYLKIFALREGGLAIYGGIIAGILTGLVFCKIKKIKIGVLADVSAQSLLLGQIIGRWANFVNREAFGGYSDTLLALRYKVSQISYIPVSLFDTIFLYNGVEYIQVQPTFLYESLWNMVVLLFLMLYKRHKKYDGEIFLLYLLGYSLGRLWIEGLRTDQLIIGQTNIAASQLLSAILIVISLGMHIYNRVTTKEIKHQP